MVLLLDYLPHLGKQSYSLSLKEESTYRGWPKTLAAARLRPRPAWRAWDSSQADRSAPYLWEVSVNTYLPPLPPTPHIVQPAPPPFPSVTHRHIQVPKSLDLPLPGSTDKHGLCCLCSSLPRAASGWHARRGYKMLQIPIKSKSHSEAGWHKVTLWEMASPSGTELQYGLEKTLGDHPVQPLLQAGPTTIGVLGALSYNFRAPLRRGLRDWSPVHMPQGLTTLMVKTHFPISHVPGTSHPNSACLWEESASTSSKASMSELRKAVRSPLSLLKAEESCSSWPLLICNEELKLGHSSTLK